MTGLNTQGCHLSFQGVDNYTHNSPTMRFQNPLESHLNMLIKNIKKFGADDGTRTRILFERQILSLLRLPFRHVRIACTAVKPVRAGLTRQGSRMLML